MAIPASVAEFVKKSGVSYTLLHHAPAFTAQQEAAATHVPGREWAKTVVCLADGRPMLAVLPAHCKVDVEALKEMADAADLRLATEKEFAGMYPDCETGAMTPFGPLYGQPVFVEQSLAADREIVFHAGTHTDAIRMRYEDFARLVHPITGHFARLASH
jgi:Ala-tRNA(Pro) deacylase